MSNPTPDVEASAPRTAKGTEAFVRNAARRRIRRHLADWLTMPDDTFDDPEIAAAVVTLARDIASRAGITLIGEVK